MKARGHPEPARGPGRRARARTRCDGPAALAGHRGQGHDRRRGDARGSGARRRRPAAYDAVLAVGGDGTANEAAWGLLGSRHRARPRAHGLRQRPRAHARASRCARSARWTRWRARCARRMDVGMVNGRPFLNVAGAGFDAAVGADFHAHGLRGGRRGVFTYVRLQPAAHVVATRAEQWTLHAGEERLRGARARGGVRERPAVRRRGRHRPGRAARRRAARRGGDRGRARASSCAWNATAAVPGRHRAASGATGTCAATDGACSTRRRPVPAPPRRRAGGRRDAQLEVSRRAAGAGGAGAARRPRTIPRGPFGPRLDRGLRPRVLARSTPATRAQRLLARGRRQRAAAARARGRRAARPASMAAFRPATP